MLWELSNIIRSARWSDLSAVPSSCYQIWIVYTTRRRAAIGAKNRPDRTTTDQIRKDFIKKLANFGRHYWRWQGQRVLFLLSTTVISKSQQKMALSTKFYREIAITLLGDINRCSKLLRKKLPCNLGTYFSVPGSWKRTNSGNACFDSTNKIIPPHRVGWVNIFYRRCHFEHPTRTLSRKWSGSGLMDGS